jgi:xanthine dehydrogenase YagT iron-sulfur-binding subunit
LRLRGGWRGGKVHAGFTLGNGFGPVSPHPLLLPLPIFDMADATPLLPGKPGSLSRRNFLKTFGATAVASAGAGAEAVARELEQANAERPHGPGAVPVVLLVNGQRLDLALEPRVTLLDALRYHAGMTGSKEGCDRASCGACTVLLDGEPVYACMLLAIDVQGQAITTIEGLGSPENLSPLQAAFVEADASQCGYCTPGFVMCAHALLQVDPHPTEEAVRKACSGNICRCGTQPHILQAVRRAADGTPPPPPEMIRLNHEELA